MERPICFVSNRNFHSDYQDADIINCFGLNRYTSKHNKNHSVVSPPPPSPGLPRRPQHGRRSDVRHPPRPIRRHVLLQRGPQLHHRYSRHRACFVACAAVSLALEKKKKEVRGAILNRLTPPPAPPASFLVPGGCDGQPDGLPRLPDQRRLQSEQQRPQ